MSGIWRRNIELSIFGESHGDLIGITLNGIQPGVKLDLEFIQSELNRRKPGSSKLTTPRKEADALNIVSGCFKGYTTGAPLTLIIENTNTKSRDYGEVEKKYRPGHADYSADVKYKGYGDYRGGGHFSGRLTAGIVFAGAIAKQLLKEKNIFVGSIITQIGSIKDTEMPLDEVTADFIQSSVEKKLPVYTESIADDLSNEILKHHQNEDSIGGRVRCFATNIPPGLGSPFFDSFESVLSHLIFSIPAIKGIEFGKGFDLASLSGFESNDEYYVCGDDVRAFTNNNGGILGGITNGMPLDFSVVIKSTPSIGREQRTVTKAGKEDTSISVQGRHDPCILPRALPVIEAAAALTILDFLKD